MIDYFNDQMRAMLPSLDDLSTIESKVELFKVERMQFDADLPIYTRKKEFLQLLHSCQCVVLKAGTGVGKLSNILLQTVKLLACRNPPPGMTCIAPPS